MWEAQPGSPNGWVGHSGNWTAHSRLHIVRLVRTRRTRGPWAVQVWSKWLPDGTERVLLRWWDVKYRGEAPTMAEAKEVARQWLQEEE